VTDGAKPPGDDTETFGVGTTDGMVVGGRSGGPNGGAAGASGAAVVPTEGAGAIAGLGGAIGMPGDGGAASVRFGAV
jgi:hypothetical protein